MLPPLGDFFKVQLTRTVFQIFEGIDILSVWVNEQPTLRQVLNLRSVHQQVIRLFGSQVCNCYFLDP